MFDPGYNFMAIGISDWCVQHKFDIVLNCVWPSSNGFCGCDLGFSDLWVERLCCFEIHRFHRRRTTSDNQWYRWRRIVFKIVISNSPNAFDELWCCYDVDSKSELRRYFQSLMRMWRWTLQLTLTLQKHYSEYLSSWSWPDENRNLMMNIFFVSAIEQGNKTCARIR